MNTEFIIKVVPNADPEFLKVMEQIPDPSKQTQEKVMSFLQQLHDLFLQKRKAAESGDHDLFIQIMEKEMRIIAELDNN
ncbi:hypothetical protein KKG46_02825 [Patescibacteria group bacterium]|nr:hypothetical protein [Patescibacteria group bacterium]